MLKDAVNRATSFENAIQRLASACGDTKIDHQEQTAIEQWERIYRKLSESGYDIVVR